MNIIQQLYLALMAAVAREKPHKCNIQDLTRPALDWRFDVNLTCNSDQVIDMEPADIARTAAVGLECTYDFSCPLDPPGPYRRTSLVCESTGNWHGTMPDCTAHDRLAESILSHFGEGERTEGTDEEERRTEEEEEGVTFPSGRPTASIREGNAKKGSGKGNGRPTLMDICDSQQMCANIRTMRDCFSIIPKVRNNRFMPRFRQMLTGLCFYCFKNLCSNSVTLL